MRICHVITGMRKAAGTSVFCGEVANALAASGHEVAIATASPGERNIYPLDSRVRLVSIDSALREDWSLVHIHALWSPVLHKASRLAHRRGVPVVWSVHGMLTKWAMHCKWWKKLPAWWLYQKRDLAASERLHATARSEVEDFRRMGLANAVIVAPLGVRPAGGALNRPTFRERPERILLFVSRVQRKKGLENLIRAWSLVKAAATPGESLWRVRIVGPDQENHAAELKALCAKLAVAEDFDFAGPRYGDELQREYAAADLFVLPSHSENFGSVVIEALAHGVSVITTKGTPWRELEERKCGWWIDIGVEPLACALKEAMALTDDERRRQCCCYCLLHDKNLQKPN